MPHIEGHPPIENQNAFKNLVGEIGKDALKKIGENVVRGYEVDDASREKWKEMHASWIKLFAMQRDPKNEPWENCSNIGLPVLTTACIQFHASAYPSLLPPRGIIKDAPVKPGADAKDVASRKARYMNYYLTRKSGDFLESMDTTLLKLGIEGTVIRKRFYDPIENIVVSDWISPINFVINNDVRYLSKAERYTHVLFETENIIRKKGEMGFYANADDLGPGNPDDVSSEEYDMQKRSNIGYQESGERDDKTIPRKILEQYVDLDIEGKSRIRKPYVVTVDHETKRVLRVVKRENPITGEKLEFFTKYGFIKNPEGFYDFGFGLLLEKPNKAVNSIINQLIDSGSLQNVQGGFVSKSSGLKRKTVEWVMGKFNEIDLRSDDIRKEVMPFKFGSPSQVLFSLLGALQQYVDKLTTVTELKTGALPKSDTSATAVTALIEEGQRVFSVIHQRNHRSFAREIDGIHDLIGIHLDLKEYFEITIDPEIDMQEPVINPETGQEEGVQNIDTNTVFAMLKDDWGDSFRGVSLVSDPNITSRQEKVAKAQFLYETTINSPVTSQNQENILNAQKALYKAMDMDEDIVIQVTQAQVDEGPPDLPQEEENQIFLKDGMVDAIETQDHQRHIEVMDEFEQSEFFQFLTPIGSKNFDLHKRQHIAFLYAQTVDGLNQQDQQQIQNQAPVIEGAAQVPPQIGVSA